MVSAERAGTPGLRACPGAGLEGGLTGGAGRGRIRAPSPADALQSLAQSALRARTASMTDALLPAAPQPLEKESDGYFRKVRGFGWAGSLRRAPDLLPPGCGGGCGSPRQGSTRPGGGGGSLAWGGRSRGSGRGLGRRCTGLHSAGGFRGWGRGGVPGAAPRRWWRRLGARGARDRPGWRSRATGERINAYFGGRPRPCGTLGPEPTLNSSAWRGAGGGKGITPGGLAFSFCLQNASSVCFLDFQKAGEICRWEVTSGVAPFSARSRLGGSARSRREGAASPLLILCQNGLI